MPLSKILLDIATESGIALSNDNERAWIIDKVNDVAKELYELQDIEGCLREISVNIDTDVQSVSQVSLPYYVYQLRGLRFSQILGGKVPYEDMRPRYSLGRGWGANTFSLPFRMTRQDYPLKRDISNASVLTFSVEEAQTAAIDIYIVGRTTLATRVQEKVTIAIGDLTVDTVGNFIEVESISKTAPNDCDIAITDVEGNELATIANSEISPRYMILELRDGNVLGANSSFISYAGLTSVDVLYKTRFVPFRNLQDEFPCGSKCDRAIFYQFMAYYEAQKQGNEGRAGYYQSKARELLRNINKDTEEGKNLEMQFGRNGLHDAQQPFNNWYRKDGKDGYAGSTY